MLMALNFKRRYHAIIVPLIFENVFYVEKNFLSWVYFSFEFSLFECCFLFQFIYVIRFA